MKWQAFLAVILFVPVAHGFTSGGGDRLETSGTTGGGGNGYDNEAELLSSGGETVTSKTYDQLILDVRPDVGEYQLTGKVSVKLKNAVAMIITKEAEEGRAVSIDQALDLILKK